MIKMIEHWNRLEFYRDTQLLETFKPLCPCVLNKRYNELHLKAILDKYNETEFEIQVWNA